jgi:hypothetical protein
VKQQESTAELTHAQGAASGREPLDKALVEFEQVGFDALARRQPSVVLPPPTPSPPGLPLALLNPEAFERVVAEVVSRRDHRGVQFYGRRGQKQYGLDVVELNPQHEYSLYQVKRYQVLSPAEIESAVNDYAGPPRDPDYTGLPRRFEPRRFVLVTSAEFDSDTANVDKFKELREKYRGDLDLEVWGAEALNRMLRDAPRLVHAMFGPSWSKAYCAFDPSPEELAAPAALGFVEDPAEVLGLSHVVADAHASEGADPRTAANLFRTAADALSEKGFPGHGNVLRRREAAAAAAAGDRERAFDVLWALDLEQVLASEPVFESMLTDLCDLASGSPILEARFAALSHAVGWYEGGTNLSEVVPALRTLIENNDQEAATACCLALEGAVADGLFDFSPPVSIMGDTDASTLALLNELRDLTASAESADRTLRARQRCALADATLPAAATAVDVDAAYSDLAKEAAAGRFLTADSLVASRAARQFALHADTNRADNLWRQSVRMSCETGRYGDSRAALRSMTLLSQEAGIFTFPQIKELVAAMPNRRQLLGGPYDPILSTLEAAHNGRLPDAFADARRALLRAAVGGHLIDELWAWSMFGDVLVAADQPVPAVHCFVQAGAAEKATATAAPLPVEVGIQRRIFVGLRRSRVAALGVLGAQVRLVSDGDVHTCVSELLVVASNIWGSAMWGPEVAALKTIAAFGVRIPAEAVDPILDLARPALEANTQVSDTVANLVVQTFWSVPSRRQDLAEAIIKMLTLPDPPYNLWSFLPGLAEARTGLTPTVETLAANGNQQAVAVLSGWGIQPRHVQLAARRACSSLLRRPVGVPRRSASIGTQESTTAEMLRTLTDANPVEQFDPVEFAAARVRPAGGTIMIVGNGEEQGAATVHEPAMDDEPDEIARVAAGPPDVLTKAVALHLLAATQDALDLAIARVQAVRALRLLIDKLAPAVAADIVKPLLGIHSSPGLNEFDEMEVRMNNPLSRFQMGGGAADLGPMALVAAAEAFKRGAAGEDIRPRDIDVARQIFAAALPLLRDLNGRDGPVQGALAVAAIGGAAPELAQLSLVLAGHPDDDVRAQGVQSIPADNALWASLATDPSPRVRAAVARRAGELPPDVVAVLEGDPHLEVRRTIAAALPRRGD